MATVKHIRNASNDDVHTSIGVLKVTRFLSDDSDSDDSTHWQNIVYSLASLPDLFLFSLIFQMYYIFVSPCKVT